MRWIVFEDIAQYTGIELWLMLFLFSAILAGIYGERWRTRTSGQKRPYKKRPFRRTAYKSASGESKTPFKPFDSAEQLRLVTKSCFSARKLLNNPETRLLETVERAIAEENLDWRAMAQVSMGEILSSPDSEAYRAINSKRVDLLIIGADRMPVCAIEYQGGGHYQGNAAVRDAVKKEALRRADIPYIEVIQGDTPAEVRRHIAKLAARPVPYSKRAA